MGAVGALALAGIRKRLNYEMVRSALDTTGNLATFVMFILIGSTVFALTFRAVNGDLWVEHLFSLVPGGQWGFLVVVSALVFVLGFFIDFFEIAFILLPLFAPVAEKLGIDMVWFLVLIGMNMQTSFLTPPFGFALFYLRSVAPSTSYEDTQTGKTIAGIKTMQIYRGVIPFIVIQIFALIMILVFPSLVTGGLEEHVKVDLDSVEINIQQNTYGGGSAYDTPAFPSLQDSDGGGAAPAAEPDPNAALMDALRDAPAPESK